MDTPLAFEFTSRGDLVRTRLFGAGSRRPLVLVAAPLGSEPGALPLEALCRALVREGLAAATLDLPLQGERASRKLTDRLLAAAGAANRTPAEARLWAGFVRQAALDLAAAADALAVRGALGDPLACLAFEPGAEAAAEWAARDPRVACLCRAAPGSDPAELARTVRERLRAVR